MQDNSLPATCQAGLAEFDHDGDLDPVTAGKPFRNQVAPRSWLAVRLEGDGAAVDRLAIGTQVRVAIGEQTISRHVETGTGEGNQNHLTLHFGLRDFAGPVRLEILWPSGVKQVLKDVETRRIVTARYGAR